MSSLSSDKECVERVRTQLETMLRLRRQFGWTVQRYSVGRFTVETHRRLGAQIYADVATVTLHDEPVLSTLPSGAVGSRESVLAFHAVLAHEVEYLKQTNRVDRRGRFDRWLP